MVAPVPAPKAGMARKHKEIAAVFSGLPIKLYAAAPPANPNARPPSPPRAVGTMLRLFCFGRASTAPHVAPVVPPARAPSPTPKITLPIAAQPSDSALRPAPTAPPRNPPPTIPSPPPMVEYKSCVEGSARSPRRSSSAASDGRIGGCWDDGVPETNEPVSRGEGAAATRSFPDRAKSRMAMGKCMVVKIRASGRATPGT